MKMKDAEAIVQTAFDAAPRANKEAETELKGKDRLIYGAVWVIIYDARNAIVRCLKKQQRGTYLSMNARTELISLCQLELR
jgi:hypothetical protein